MEEEQKKNKQSLMWNVIYADGFLVFWYFGIFLVFCFVDFSEKVPRKG